jgi:hypothetical protein
VNPYVSSAVSGHSTFPSPLTIVAAGAAATGTIRARRRSIPIPMANLSIVHPSKYLWLTGSGKLKVSEDTPSCGIDVPPQGYARKEFVKDKDFRNSIFGRNGKKFSLKVLIR